MQEKEKIPQRIMVGIEEEESTSQFARWFRMVCNTSRQLQKQNYNQSQKQKNELTHTAVAGAVYPTVSLFYYYLHPIDDEPHSDEPDEPISSNLDDESDSDEPGLIFDQLLCQTPS